MDNDRFKLGAEPIVASVLTLRDVEGAAHALTEVFTDREPLSLALGIRYDEMKGFSRMLCEQAAHSGLSVVAKDSAGRIVAFSISEKWPAPPPEGPPLEGVFPRQSPIFALLAQCEAWFDAAYRGDNEALHIMVVGAIQGYEGRGLTKRVVTDSLALARKRGISRAYTEATSASHHLFSRLGFETRHEIVYRDFMFGGGKPFASITSVPSTKLMVCDLGGYGGLCPPSTG